MKDGNKELVAVSLTPMILMILRQGKSYGYEIIQQLKEKSGGKLEVAEGTLYPVLKKMEEKGWITAAWSTADNGRERRYYTLTKKGGENLETQVAQWNSFHQIIQRLWNPGISIFSGLL
ncbi:MAG TPA: PadR family transcriptional regulator [Dinghuibacter sp.]|uniref:PadR family transcriptional regulator n=1 Tax=Dinghuibacter sp. TaxID=2024697 RepID=UPI002BBA9418|nr:PadR family transcriptional regulator [Dinghuibacter sp.]HTJ12293.1 PadR family transcriptional regulator [Dinghuibacter sp.]